MLSNSALKLPSPKPSSPLRWMNSKKIGPMTFLREDLQQHLGLAALDDALAVDQQAELAQPVDRLAVVGQALVAPCRR